MNKGKLLTIVFVVAVVGLFLFVGLSDNSRGGGGVSSQFGEERTAPQFTLSNLEGGTISLADYKGEKPVVLDFFATWCPNCRRDMPKLSRWYEQYSDRVEVIGIDLQEPSATVQKYIQAANISFPIVLDTTGSTSRDYLIRFTNTHVLIDKEGNIYKTIPGDIRERDILELIEA